MKILLIYPYCLENRIHTEDVSVVPMGLYSIGAILKENGCDVKILNLQGWAQTPEKIKDLLREEKSDIIGFSILNANRWGGIEIAQVAKEIDENVKIVFGGVSATYLWFHFLSYFPTVDYVVLGEGEKSFLKLVRFLQEGKGEGEGIPEGIDGLAFRRDGEPECSPEADLISEPDETPNPAKYFTYTHLSLTRGCPSRCTFCGSPDFWKNKVRFHSADYFVDQMEMLYRKGVSHFYVSDDIFTMQPRRVIEICRKIIDRNLDISWAAISKVSHVDEEMLFWMRRAGCMQISYGVESGSEKIRNVLGKNITFEQIEKAFRLTQSFGIMARAYFIYGSPGETWKSIEETIALMKAIQPLSVIFYILALFPGTLLYESYKKKAGITDDIWLNPIEDILYFQVDPELTQEMILSFGKKLRESFYDSLPDFARSLKLIDDERLYPRHADFFSRLGMTFSHGDYAIDEVSGHDGIAAELFERALTYGDDPRAYLGLGLLSQKRRDHGKAMEWFSQGNERFPDNLPLHMGAGVSLMNMGEFQKALNHFECCGDDPDARNYIEECRKKIGWR